MWTSELQAEPAAAEAFTKLKPIDRGLCCYELAKARHGADSSPTGMLTSSHTGGCSWRTLTCRSGSERRWSWTGMTGTRSTPPILWFDTRTTRFSGRRHRWHSNWMTPSAAGLWIIMCFYTTIIKSFFYWNKQSESKSIIIHACTDVHIVYPQGRMLCNGVRLLFSYMCKISLS